MKKSILSLCFLLLFAISCGKGPEITQVGQDSPWASPYVSSSSVSEIEGLENLAFDGEGSMFVTGLNGYIFRVVPTDSAYNGKVTAKKKIGKLCLGVAVGPDGFVYAGVQSEDDEKRIVKLTKDFSAVTPVSDSIEGLNGFCSDGEYLYFTFSNESFFFPDGGVYRVKFGSDENFKKPEIVLDDAGMVNGLALSNDKNVLYYTEMTGGLWAFDFTAKTKTKIFANPGLMHIYDDITVGQDDSVWMCMNSRLAVLKFKDNKFVAAYSPGDLKVPSSIEFGNGPGFDPESLYITEFGLKGRSATMNGRGIWMFPVK